MKSQDLPATQLEAIRYFSSDERCHDFLVSMRWPEAVRCVHCTSANVGKLVVSAVKSRSKKNPDATITRRLWNCKACKKQFTTKTGTIFEDSPLGLDKWLPAVWLLCNAKNGISSCELARALGITQKSAWHMGHRIRTAMRAGGFDKFSGEIEADETFIGGKAINMHAARRRTLPNKGVGGMGKTVVHGMLERSVDGTSRVQATVIPNTQKATIKPILDNAIEVGSTLYSDTAMQYLKLDSDLMHEMVDHAIEYVRGKVHTNGMENFWSLLKRSLKGTYVSVDPVHLFRYIDEQVARFNERKGCDQDRFIATMQRVAGKYLSYAQLTGASTA
jgi:transposase-like protein